MNLTPTHREKILAVLNDFNINLSFGDGLRFFDRIQDIIKPAIIRTEREHLADLLEGLADDVRNNVEDGADINLKDMMRNHDMDPSIRADRIAARKFLEDAGLLQRISAQPARFVKRITTEPKKPPADPSNGASPSPNGSSTTE